MYRMSLSLVSAAGLLILLSHSAAGGSFDTFVTQDMSDYDLGSNDSINDPFYGFNLNGATLPVRFVRVNFMLDSDPVATITGMMLNYNTRFPSDPGLHFPCVSFTYSSPNGIGQLANGVNTVECDLGHTAFIMDDSGTGTETPPRLGGTPYYISFSGTGTLDFPSDPGESRGITNLTFSDVPEPGSWLLVGLGVTLLAICRRRQVFQPPV